MLRIDRWDEHEWELQENLERVRLRRSQPRTQQPDHRFDAPPGAAIGMLVLMLIAAAVLFVGKFFLGR